MNPALDLGRLFHRAEILKAVLLQFIQGHVDMGSGQIRVVGMSAGPGGLGLQPRIQRRRVGFGVDVSENPLVT